MKKKGKKKQSYNTGGQMGDSVFNGKSNPNANLALFASALAPFLQKLPSTEKIVGTAQNVMGALGIAPEGFDGLGEDEAPKAFAGAALAAKGGGYNGQASFAAGEMIAALTSGFASLIPDQQDMKLLRPEDRYAVNQNPFGTGSQALFEDGGTIGSMFKRKRKKGNIQIEEDFSPVAPSSVAPMVSVPSSVKEEILPSQGITSYTIDNFSPQQSVKKKVSFEKLFDPEGNLYAYSPVYTGYNRHDASREMQYLPESFGGVPVLKSPDLFSEVNQGFIPGSTSQDWKPYMKNGGKIPEYRNGGKAPIYTDNPKDPRIQKYQDSVSKYNKTINYMNQSSQEGFMPVGRVSYSDYKKDNSGWDNMNYYDSQSIKPHHFLKVKNANTTRNIAEYTQPTQPVFYQPSPTKGDKTNIGSNQLNEYLVPEQMSPLNIPLQANSEAEIAKKVLVKGYNDNGPKAYRHRGFQTGLERVYDEQHPRPEPIYGFKNGGKLYEDGGNISEATDYVEGGEYDLSPAEIERLISQGYQIDF